MIFYKNHFVYFSLLNFIYFVLQQKSVIFALIML
nr:MAG TPA: hypothetical protein [Caudoviricetes sp.]